MSPKAVAEEPDQPLESPIDADDHPSATTTTAALRVVTGPIGCLEPEDSEDERPAAPELASRWFLFRRQWPITVWLVLVWIGLWGDVSAANVLGGLAVALLLALFCPMPIFPARLRVRPVAFARLAGRFALDLVKASVHVAWLAWRPGPTPSVAVLRLQLSTRSEAVLTVVAELTSLVPGSIVLETDAAAGVLYVHSLDVSTPQDIARIRREALDLEARVIAAFSGDRARRDKEEIR